MREIIDYVAGVHVIVGTFSNQIETDDAFAAALALLTPRLLERHVEPRKCVPIARGPCDLFRPGKRCLGVEILHAHELFLPTFAKYLKIIRSHARDSKLAQPNQKLSKDRGLSC